MTLPLCSRCETQLTAAPHGAFCSACTLGFTTRPSASSMSDLDRAVELLLLWHPASARWDVLLERSCALLGTPGLSHYDLRTHLPERVTRLAGEEHTVAICSLLLAVGRATPGERLDARWACAQPDAEFTASLRGLLGMPRNTIDPLLLRLQRAALFDALGVACARLETRPAGPHARAVETGLKFRRHAPSVAARRTNLWMHGEPPFDIEVVNSSLRDVLTGLLPALDALTVRPTPVVPNLWSESTSA